MDQEWARRVRERLAEMNMTMKAASQEAGFNYSFVRDMLERGRVPSVDKFAKLASVLGTTVAELLGDSPSAGVVVTAVPLMGYVGAGAEVEPDFEQVPDDGLDQINVPFPVPADMIALQVKGDSMLPQFRDGTVLIVYREQRRSLESFLGEEAAVRTADGRRFIKTIIRGNGAGRVTLTSWNAAPIENVRVVWVGEIFSVFPAATMRRVAKAGGIQGRLKLA